MAYQVEKVSANQWAIRNLDTGNIVGVADSEKKALGSIEIRKKQGDAPKRDHIQTRAKPHE